MGSLREELKLTMKYLLVCVFVGCVAGLAIEPVGRTTLDEEELLHAMEARNEAIEMEMGEAEENKNVVEAAPEERHIGAGLGFQFLGLGAGASAGLGNGGIGFNGNAGLGQNFANYGTRPHYSQYYTNPQRTPWFSPNQLYY